MEKLTGPRAARAFTILETVVVLVLMGALVSVGLYSYTSFAQRGSAVDAKEKLHSMATREQSFSRSWGSYTASSADLHAVANQPSLTSGTSAGPDEVSAAVGVQGTLGLAVQVTGGGCVYAQVAPLLVSGDVSFVTRTGACAGAIALPEGESAAPPAQISQ